VNKATHHELVHGLLKIFTILLDLADIYCAPNDAKKDISLHFILYKLLNRFEGTQAKARESTCEVDQS